MPLPDEARHAAVTRSWGRDVREDLQETQGQPRKHLLDKVGRNRACAHKRRKAVLSCGIFRAGADSVPDERQKRVARRHNTFLTVDLDEPQESRRQKNEG